MRAKHRWWFFLLQLSFVPSLPPRSLSLQTGWDHTKLQALQPGCSVTLPAQPRDALPCPPLARRAGALPAEQLASFGGWGEDKPEKQHQRDRATGEDL